MKRIFLVDDDKENITALQGFLANAGVTFQSAGSSDDVLHRFRVWSPHLIILNLDTLQINLEELIYKMRVNRLEEYSGVFLMSRSLTPEGIKKMMGWGVDDFIFLPWQEAELVVKFGNFARMKELQDLFKRANVRLEQLSSTDELTGLMNMRTAYRRAEEEITRARTFKRWVSGILLNIDAFCEINQRYGFAIGSRVLQEVAQKIKRLTRAEDLISRVGADEFFVFMNGVNLQTAEVMARRIKEGLQAEPFCVDKCVIRMTFTVGVASMSYEQTDQRMGDLLRCSTEALRSAKASGANQLETYSFI